VLAAIRFDDQARAEMHEIDHIGADLLLAPEFLAIHAVRAQVPPQCVFAVGHVLSQVFDEGDWRNGPLSPALSSEGRGGVPAEATGAHGVTSSEVPTRCVTRPLVSAIGRARERISRCVPSWRVMR